MFKIFKTYRTGGWLPHVWYGMRFGDWMGLLGRNRFAVTFNCLPSVVAITFFSLVNSVLYRISELIYRRRAEQVEITEPPVFVLGHQRSGTTLLYELLAGDPEFTTPNTCQCVYPSHFLLSQSFVTRRLGAVLPKRRPMDNVQIGWKKPQEDDMALALMGIRSPLLTMAFPNHGPAELAYRDLRTLSDRERQRWIDGLLWFLKRVTLKRRRRLVLKSPWHTARIKTLLQIFPEARFVYISRNPWTVYASSYRLYKSGNSVQALQNPAKDDEWLQEFILDAFRHMDSCYEEDRQLIPPGHLVEIRYEDLIPNPIGQLKMIYERLELGDFSRAEKNVRAYLDQTRDYKTNKYDPLSPQTRQLIATAWSRYIERNGYGELA